MSSGEGGAACKQSNISDAPAIKSNSSSQNGWTHRGIAEEPFSVGQHLKDHEVVELEMGSVHFTSAGRLSDVRYPGEGLYKPETTFTPAHRL